MSGERSCSSALLEWFREVRSLEGNKMEQLTTHNLSYFAIPAKGFVAAGSSSSHLSCHAVAIRAANL